MDRNSGFLRLSPVFWGPRKLVNRLRLRLIPLGAKKPDWTGLSSTNRRWGVTPEVGNMIVGRRYELAVESKVVTDEIDD